MDYRNRIIRLKIFFFCLMALVFAGILIKMTVQNQEISRTVFVDQKKIAFFKSLAEDGLITPGENRSVVIHENRLNERFENPYTVAYVMKREPYLFFRDGRLEVEPAAVSVADRRQLRQAVDIGRGDILDRHAAVLARTARLESGEVVRQYPLGDAGFPLLGVAHAVYGKKGLEQALDPYLEGQVSQGVFRRVLQFFLGQETNCNVVLTLDADLQKQAYQAIQGKTGAVVVVEAATGEILAAASSPSFDPDTSPGIQWDEAEKKRSAGPFVNRAFQKRYPPGSTFKLVVAAAWMEKPGSDMTWGLECRGIHPKYGIREYRGKRHGWMGLKNAVIQSCNVFFAEAAVRLGPDLLYQAKKFGFNQPLVLWEGSDGLAFSALSSRAFLGYTAVRDGQEWDSLDFKYNPRLVAQAGIGQNLIETTPLQMAMVGAAIGNNGMMKKPVLVKKIWHRRHAKTFSSKKGNRVMTAQTAALLLDMMAGVTDKGTGHGLKKIVYRDGTYIEVPFLEETEKNVLAGKTGTAETGTGLEDHSWFVAVAPADNPRYAMAVIIENGGKGAQSAGPVAVTVMTQALNKKF
jgi:penicillin-binding protein A